MVTIYNTTLSATSQRHFSDGLGGGKNQVFCMVMIFCMSVHAQSIYRTKVVAG